MGQVLHPVRSHEGTGTLPLNVPPAQPEAVGVGTRPGGASVVEAGPARLFAAESAFWSPAAQVRLWLVVGVGLALDLWSKHWAFSQLGAHEVQAVVPGVLSFRRSLNPGALFGWGKGLVPLFIVASIVALGFVIYLFIGSHRRQRFLHVALALILAGALGNLYDRAFITATMVTRTGPDGEPADSFIGKLVSPPDADPIVIGNYPDGSEPHSYRRSSVTIRPLGVVRDFLKIDLQVAGRDVWPWVFNVADSMLVVGVGFLLIEFWFVGRRLKAPPAVS